jgi:hypothetical protein
MQPLKKSFTLIEILIVIILLSLFYYLSVKYISYKKPLKIKDLYINLYPDGKVDISNFGCKAYDYYDGKLREIKKKYYNVKNGIGDSFILECSDKVYFFRPFDIKEYNNTDEIINSMEKYLNEGIY